MLNNGSFVITADSSTEARRIWDICANRIIPMSWFQGNAPLSNPYPPPGIAHISHDWVANTEIKNVLTKVNGCTWPVPIPKDIEIEDIRNGMLRLNMKYVWLDVLCLRQNIEPFSGLLQQLGNPLYSTGDRGTEGHAAQRVVIGCPTHWLDLSTNRSIPTSSGISEWAWTGITGTPGEAGVG